MVLEVVSPSSETKDKIRLLDAYWEAGIREYWVVDARGDEPAFEIYRHTANGYVATRKKEGWIKSAVFGQSFRITHRLIKTKMPEFNFELKSR